MGIESRPLTFGNPLLRFRHQDGGTILCRAVPRNAVLHVPSSVPVDDVAEYVEQRRDGLEGFPQGDLPVLQRLFAQSPDHQYRAAPEPDTPVNMHIRILGAPSASAAIRRALLDYAPGLESLTLVVLKDDAESWRFVFPIVQYVEVLRRQRSARPLRPVVEAAFGSLPPGLLGVIDRYNCRLVADELLFLDETRSLANIAKMALAGAKVTVRLRADARNAETLYPRAQRYLQANRDGGLDLALLRPVVRRGKVVNESRLPDPRLVIDAIRRIRYQLLSSDDSLDWLAAIKRKIASATPPSPRCAGLARSCAFCTGEGTVSSCRYARVPAARPQPAREGDVEEDERRYAQWESWRRGAAWALATFCGTCEWLPLCGGICPATLADTTLLPESARNTLKDHWCLITVETVKDMLADLTLAGTLAREESSQ